MTAFRLTRVHSLLNDDQSWPIVEWKEVDDTKVMAIFHLEDKEDSESGNWLMHQGVDMRADGEVGFRWEKSSIDWNVSKISILKLLFQVAQHTLGILQWPQDDAIQLYGRNNRV